AIMARLAIRGLGAEGLAEKLDYAPELANATDERTLVGRLLTTVYQSTRNSSVTTRDAARAVADAVGATHFELDVDPIVEAYVSKINGAIGRGLSFPTESVAAQ